MPKKQDIDKLSDDTTYEQLLAGQENPNALDIDIISSSFYLFARKICKEHFHNVYNNLLTKISNDYDIELDELKENYPFEIKVYKKKPKDPSLQCKAPKKDGTICTNTRKEGHDYCGVHLKSKNAPYSERGKSNGQPRKGTYVPREETEAEKARREELEKERLLDIQSGGTYTPHEDNSDNQSDESAPDLEVDVEIEEIEGEKYLTCGHKIFELPENVEGLSLEDLTLLGIKRLDGTVTWKK